jgi:hypothetical protein
MNFREQLHKARFGPICNVGGSSSSSASNTTTNNQDNRQSVSGGTGTSTTGNGNNITVNSLDDGAITAAFGTANSAINGVVSEGTSALDANTAVTQAAMANSNSIANSAIGAVQTSSANFAQLLDQAMSADANNLASAYSNNASTLATAYQDADTSDQRTIVLGGIAIAIAALYFISQRKA